MQHPDMYFTQPMPLFGQSSSLSSDPSDETSQPAVDERILSFSHESVADAEGSHHVRRLSHHEISAYMHVLCDTFGHRGYGPKSPRVQRST